MKTIIETAQDRYVNLCGEWQVHPGHDDNDHADETARVPRYPFVLIETSTYGQTWITLHLSANAAAQAHVSQEYPEDWQCDVIEDLRTGERYDLEITAKAVKRADND